MNKQEILNLHTANVSRRRILAAKVRNFELTDEEAKPLLAALDTSISVLGQVFNHRISKKSALALS